MRDAYHPDTLEHIPTDAPADWMLRAKVATPAYNQATAGCFWRGDHWEIVQAQPPVKPAPEVVTMRQARLALLAAGLLDQVNTTVANMPGAEGATARIEWEFSGAVERHRPLVQSLGAALRLTDAQLDDLFRQAAAL